MLQFILLLCHCLAFVFLNNYPLSMNFGSFTLSVVESEHEGSELLELVLELVQRLHVVEHGRHLEGAFVVRQSYDPRNVLEVALLHQVDRLGRHERHR